jgi:hypothetical protein
MASYDVASNSVEALHPGRVPDGRHEGQRQHVAHQDALLHQPPGAQPVRHRAGGAGRRKLPKISFSSYMTFNDFQQSLPIFPYSKNILLIIFQLKNLELI